MAWEGPTEFHGSDTVPVLGRDCGLEVREGPGIAKFEGVFGVEEVDGFGGSGGRMLVGDFGLRMR